MQCNQSTSAFSKICVSRFPERLNSKVEIYPNFCPSSIVPFCNFGIMAWLEGEINENGESVKKSSKQKFY